MNTGAGLFRLRAPGGRAAGQGPAGTAPGRARRWGWGVGRLGVCCGGVRARGNEGGGAGAERAHARVCVCALRRPG
jgi:hypothetical protein